MGSDVDQKYLGILAKETAETKPELSAALYKILGLTTLLNRKMVRARKLDPTRTTKSLDLYKHILWMAREGNTILESQVIPNVDEFTELKVLAYKLKASFLHIFVLFDQSYNAKNMMTNLGFPSPLPSPNLTEKERQLNTLHPLNYVSPTIDAFIKADELATKLLPGIHPLRLSVKLEFSAFTYDCTKDHEASRRLAMRGIDEALQAMQASSSEDDEVFEEASQLIGSLAVMAHRGLSPKPNKHSPRTGNGNSEPVLPPSISPTPVSYGKSLRGH